ncbi:CAMK/CAMKL/AMPK protein kinase [Aphanomyces astaci]|uniref:non-specific serine/threonine protein kinase n=1 Tax=Aphanomyces astaci TaxID=112090 RepID=W4GNN1_APHAT|nr:CAMK/CAMKL/AMPK protein kinase [Aphanomyces astaci]ETV80961.1 CAMK/CAMKL/AMPK protein kinase [Aphanomyces astaci]|eukprot:XP_009829908.1 CAMK/CAMKL/AMPK protein kinase [Aphanomyces astaci]
MVKKVGKYEIGKTLGEGTFGKVKYAVNTETDERVAIKVLDKDKIQKQNMGAQIKKEISIMKMVRNRHVVVLKEVLASRTKIFIVLELITGGELFDKIVSEGRFNEETARFYFRQLVNGVEYCHSQGVCHRDLKPENLLLDENGDLKISDFGLSALYEGGGPDGAEGSRASLLHTTCGTPNYVAPEVLADKGYDGRAADVWSIGVILYVLLAGFLPFDEPTMSALFRKIQKAEFSYPSWFTPRVKTLLNKILVPDPETRSSLADIQQDEWYMDDTNKLESAPLRGNPLPPMVVSIAGVGDGEDDVSSAPLKTKTTLEKFKLKPSQADLDAAIQEHIGDLEITKSAKETGPKVMNAFDLINMCGGMALNRMFQSVDDKRVKRSSQFTSSLSASTILSAISDHLQAFPGCEVVADSSNFKLKATLPTPKGAVGCTVHMYVLAESLHLVEIRRGKGDIFEYHKFHTALTEQMADLINPN